MTDSPSQTWWSAAEIAEAGLPDMPGTARGVRDIAERSGWSAHPGKTRRRKGKGGGLEYHVSLFPTRARVALTQAAEAVMPEPARGRDQAWADYEKASPKARATAQDRLASLDEIMTLEGVGLTRTEAVRAVVRQRKSDGKRASEKTLWNWLSMVDGVERADWLPFLAPAAGGSKQDRTEVCEAFLDLVKQYYFVRVGSDGPPLTAAYERACDVAEVQGVPIGPEWKVRRLIAQVPTHVQLYLRKGPEAVAKFFPYQTRNKNYLQAMECVQTDYHKFDVFIRFPDREKPGRIQMIAISDVYSGKFLAYRLSETANGHTVQLTFGDLVRRYGIPQHCLMDNGHEFVNKVMAGQVKHRKRFKQVQGEVLGLFPLLGIQLHFATPGHGQAKPIERAFRDLCDRVAKHPAFVGAYTGRNPVEKPENYGSRAIPLEDFKAVLDREIAAHNARRGRRSETANKRSFNEVFEASYSNAPITKPTEEQQRLWLMRAEGIRANKDNGELKLHGSRYWAEWMWQIAGQDVTVRFDPDDLMNGLQVYTMDGSYLGDAPVLVPGDFLKVEDAKAHLRAKKAHARATKEAARQQKKMSDAKAAQQLAAAQRDLPIETLPEASVVRLPKIHPAAPKGGRRRKVVPEEEAQLTASVTRLQERMKAPAPEAHDPDVAFARAMELEQMIEDGQPLSAEQTEWLSDYQGTSEYRARLLMRRAMTKNDE
jgi:hypothetical protein